ncbi:MAG: VanZ family protein [Trueperaceae bacterium]|nr:VanZ family protein [Trueperaceae bacterium]
MTRSALVRVLRVVPAVAWAAGVWWLSSRSDPPGSGLLDLPQLDKVGHAGLFFVQTVLLRLAGLRVVPALLVAAGLGVADELHQGAVPGRTPQLADFAADLAGAVLGASAVRWLAPGRRSAR